jgi:hypothetical protein
VAGRRHSGSPPDVAPTFVAKTTRA